jgi:hypothetical protein
MRRWILPALLVIGFPTWMRYWGIQNPYVLVYMYAYAMATVVSAWWADGLLKPHGPKRKGPPASPKRPGPC